MLTWTPRVICLGHDIPGIQPCGIQPLTAHEYEQQMSRPDSTWRCPMCGAEAEFDDDSLPE